MPGKAKYCEHCKGYGGLFVQVIKRFGDDRIKERYPEKPTKESCEPCKGTGMISIETDKVPVFDVDQEANKFSVTTKLLGDDVIFDIEEKHKAHVETDEEYAQRVAEDPGADIDVPSEAPEPTEEDVEKLLEDEIEEIDDAIVSKETKDRVEKELTEEPVDEEDPVIFEETPIEADEEEMSL
jgi:hypothetical protein